MKRTSWAAILLACIGCGDDGTTSAPCHEDGCTSTADGSATASTTSDTSGTGPIGSSSDSDGSTAADTATGTTAGTTASEDTTSSEADSSTDDGDSSSSGEPAGCGDGIVDLDEECDDGDGLDGNGCDNDCTESVVVGIAAGGAHTCVALDTGVVRCWGANLGGQLGLGNTDAVGDDETPGSVPAVDLGIGITQLSAGPSYTCAVTDDETVRCWGDNYSGVLGYGNTDDVGDDEHPSTVGDNTLAGGAIATIATGAAHACAAYADGEVACWGDGNFGQLGYGNYNLIGDDEPVADAGLVDVPGEVVELALGERHSCARLGTGEVQCWGYGGWGALGYGNALWIGDNELPSAVGPVEIPTAVSVVAGGDHTCALTVFGLVWCWGFLPEGLGYLGYGSIGDDETPVGSVYVVEDMAGEAATQITAGSSHICVLLASGTVRCWGNGSNGRLGYGNTDNIGDDEAPYFAGDVDVGGPVMQVAAGDEHTCALMQSGGVRCWGAGAYGRLGYGNTEDIGDDEAPSAAGDVPLF